MATTWLNAGSACDDIASIIRSGENVVASHAIAPTDQNIRSDLQRPPQGGRFLCPAIKENKRRRGKSLDDNGAAHEAAAGIFETCRHRAMSASEGNPEDICSD